MAYPRGRRTPLKRKATYGRGTKRFARSQYRRAYFNRRRGVGRKEKKGCDVAFAATSVPTSTGTNLGIFLLNGIQEGVGSWNRIGRYIWNKSIELDLTLDWKTATPQVTPHRQPHRGCDASSCGTNSQTTRPSHHSTPCSGTQTKPEPRAQVCKTTSDTTTCSASKYYSTQS